ncbi:MAG: hypothetical protein ACREUU_12360, partial [Gammaproteobacteria bacterium]
MKWWPRYFIALAAASGLALGWVGWAGRHCLGPEQLSGAEATQPAQRKSEPAPLRRSVAEAAPTAAPDASAGAKRGALEARLPIMEGVPKDSSDDSSDPIDPDASIGSGTETAGPAPAEGWDALVQSAVADPDAERRGEALRSVSVYRGPEAMAVLTEAAVADPEPDNRLQALQSLWYAAADGLDQDGEIKRVLEYARADPD